MFCSFVLKQKNQKFKTGNSAKILNNFLKFPKLVPSFFLTYSNSGNFFTKIFQNFQTPPFPRSQKSKNLIEKV